MPAQRTARSARARLLLLPAALVVAVAVVVVLGSGPRIAVPDHATADRADAGTTATPAPAATAPTASTPGASAGPAPLSSSGAEAVVADYAAAAGSLTSDIRPDLSAVREVVSGAALQEIEAEQLELQSTGESIRGRARVSEVRLLSQGGRGAVRTARISACIDSSDVHRVDADGEVVDGATVGDQRALNLYDLRREGTAGWRIVRHTFPADTAC